MPSNGTLHQRMMPCKTYMEILQVHRAQGSEIMASLLQDMYIRQGFSPEAAKLLVREQRLDSPERLRVLTDKNVNNICNFFIKQRWQECQCDAQQGAASLRIAQESLKLAIFLFHHR